MGISGNSSVELGTSAPGPCACCHETAQLKDHWSHPDIRLCGTCITLLFTFEGNGDYTHLAYAYWVNIIGERDAGRDL
jgi:hypothetical protein